MRPIVSFCGSPTYQLSKYLTTIPQPLTDKSRRKLQSTENLIDATKTVQIPDDDKLVSFDLKSLFTSIPFQLALQCTETAIKQSTVKLPLPTGDIMDWLDCISTQANVQRFILRQYERWFQGDGNGHANHHWKTEKSSDIRRRRYRFCMAILLILSKKWNKLIMFRTVRSSFVGMKEKLNDNTYIYSRWKTDILTHICQVLSFAGWLMPSI